MERENKIVETLTFPTSGSWMDNDTGESDIIGEAHPLLRRFGFYPGRELKVEVQQGKITITPGNGNKRT